MAKLSFANETRATMPRAIFRAIADAAFPKDYSLDIAFIEAEEMRRYNLMYRNKDEMTDILSFPISKQSGEIFINVRRLKGFSVGNLFIHGLFHLKGLDHGDTMEKAEEKVRTAFKIS